MDKSAPMMRSFRIHKKADGLLLIRSDGSCRFLGPLESWAYRKFGWLPGDAK